ncbi:MAG: hypothetical protein Q7S58_11325 [Candidatus Binatus sp.]|uniref:hypothetical protein n=1 Tax=Candidatus Binatus sp. TaxID=2811406 RepID=UPI002723C15A|nr:hypothetical protein [Candidatus Binatus sp.]MDO8432987.1 hypothetical protein [Candidatus Binatus sp.]
MGETKDVQTGFLFASPSFLSGIARLFDLFCQLDFYNVSRTPEEADARATYSDWRITGQDLRDAFWAYDTDREMRQRNLFDSKVA